MSDRHAPSAEEIREHNLVLHEATAGQYDETHYYLKNGFEQRQLRRDLGAFHARLRRRTSRRVRYLDLGCGTGNLSLKLLGMGAEVVGLDLSPSMVEVLAAKASEAGLADRFTGLVGPADELSSVEGLLPLLPGIDAVCVSSVLHHLLDYLAPFKQLRALGLEMRGAFVTHEPCASAELAAAGAVRRAHNRWIRALDVSRSRRIRRPEEACGDDPVADYHAFEGGISEARVAAALADAGLTEPLMHRRYNMRRTTAAGWLDNGVFAWLRNDIFPITMFTLARVAPDA